MANEVALRSTALVLTEKEVRNYAAAFAGANMFKAGGGKMTPDQALVCIMAGQEYGWGPFAAMTNLNVIEGRPELSADAQARFIKRSGKYDFRVTKHTNQECEITVIAVPSGEIIAVETYTMEDAERQELTKLTSNGKKTNWHKAPKNMLFARCVSNVTAFHCQDAVPMRTYAQGEIRGEDRLDEEPVVFTQAEAEELQAVEATVTALVMRERGEAPGDARENEAEEPGYVCVLEEGEEPDDTAPGLQADEVPQSGTGSAPTPEPEYANPQDDPVYQTFLQQSAHFSQATKDEIRAVMAERGVPFKTSEIVKLMKADGHDEAHMWLAFRRSNAAPPTEDAGPYLPSGMASRETGSQTTVKTISDAQLGMLHARVSEAGISEAEYRTMLFRYCGVTGGREVPAADFNDLLEVIKDIKEIPLEDVERRAAYL